MGILRDAGLEYGPEVVDYISQFAKNKQTVTYKQVNEFIKAKRGKGFANTDIGGFVGEIQNSLTEVNPDWPFFNLIVVNQKGVVGKSADWHVRQRHPRLQFGSQRYNEAITIEQTEVFEWQDWASIIQCLEGLRLLARMSESALGELEEDDDDDANEDKGSPDYGSDQRTKIWAAIMARQGQGKFRNGLLEAYKRRCAISSCDYSEVLEACHIAPYLGVHTNTPENGLLLRADLHTLFDRGQLGINPTNYSIVLSVNLRNTVYGELHGQVLNLPPDENSWPSKKLLGQHLEATGLKP